MMFAVLRFQNDILAMFLPTLKRKRLREVQTKLVKEPDVDLLKKEVLEENSSVGISLHVRGCVKICSNDVNTN